MTDFLGNEVGINVLTNIGTGVGALFINVEGKYNETVNNIVVSFRSIVRYSSGTEEEVLTQGNGFRFYPSYRVIYDDQNSESVEFISGKDSYQKYDYISNGTSGVASLPSNAGPSRSNEWEITIPKKTSVGGKIELATYLRGAYYPENTTDAAPFCVRDNGEIVSVAIDSTSSPYVITFGKALDKPSKPTAISVIYPTPTNPLSLTVQWEYGNISTNPPNAPTNCQVWRKNSKSGEQCVKDYKLDQNNSSTWVKSYEDLLLDPNEKYKYMIRVLNDAGSVDSEPTDGWIYSQPAAPILTQVYSKGEKVYYNISTDNILAYTSGDFNTDPDTGNIWTNVYWRANEEGDWKPAPAIKEKSTDVIEIRGKTAFPYQGQLLEGEEPKFITSNDEEATIYKVPNIYTPWIKV